MKRLALITAVLASAFALVPVASARLLASESGGSGTVATAPGSVEPWSSLDPAIQGVLLHNGGAQRIYGKSVTQSADSQQVTMTSISGTVANGGCDSGYAVTVSGSSRIEADIGSTSATGEVYAEIISPSGNVASTGWYDTPGGGTYMIRVCSTYDAINPPTLDWRGIYATGPAGQSLLSSPAQATATGSHDIHGKAAIRTRAGLAWFTVKLDRNGSATVKVFNPVLRKTYHFAGAATTFGASSVRMTTHGMTLTVAQQRNTTQRIVFHSLRFTARGTIVRGGYVIA